MVYSRVRVRGQRLVYSRSGVRGQGGLYLQLDEVKDGRRQAGGVTEVAHGVDQEERHLVGDT